MPLAEQRGGGEVMLRQLVEHMPADGPRLQVIFLKDGPMVAELAQLGALVDVVDAGRLREPHRHAAAVLRIAGRAHRFGADVIVGWMVKSQLYAGPAALCTGVPAVWYQVGTPARRAWLERAATALPAAGVLAVSDGVAVAQQGISPRRPVRVVRPGIDLNSFDAARLPTPSEARATLGLPHDVPIVGMVGRLQHWKGMHVLIAAMARMPEAHCVVVGGAHDLEPEYPARLSSQITALGLQRSVTLAGLQRNAALWMQAMDVIVHASDREPFGIVILEAMALGKPVVAGDAGGPREIITDGVDGQLTRFGDVAGLVKALRRYLDDPDFARSVGAAARVRAADFGVERFAREFACAVSALAARNR